MITLSSVRKINNLKLAYQRLLTNPESTYKNYFRDVYTAYTMGVDDNLKLISHKLKAGFIPNSAIRVFMPKSNGLSRMYTLLSIEDQIVYQAFANCIADAIIDKKAKSRYKKSVFGNLYAGTESKFFYLPWQDSYKAYTRAVMRAYSAGHEYIASFDLTACYDSINHSLLKNILTTYHISENCASDFIRLLEKWEKADGIPLGTGIPQGPQASGIIAEAVLSKYDEYIETLQRKYDFKYYRYVDDIRILSKNKETVEWILFLLDKKSKELGLFPQSSKITIHKISNIDDEVKRISKPLFDEDFDAKKKQEIASKSIVRLIKKEPADLTSIKRYFHLVDHSYKNNKIAIATVNKFPNMVHSFAYYVQRYPRKIPKTISDYIYQNCTDKTMQFSSGILLEAIVDNISDSDVKRFSALAKKLLKEEKQNPFIVDCRFKTQLLFYSVLYGELSDKSFISIMKKETNWWVVKELLFLLQKHKLTSVCSKISQYYLNGFVDDVSLAASNYIILQYPNCILPERYNIAPIAQNTLKSAHIISRNKYTNSQINRYISQIIGHNNSFPWKKKLHGEHNQLELNFFRASCYWNTDITAFVNLWDTIDDRLCSVLVQQHPELGGYTLGNVWCIEKSCNFISNLPLFHKMVVKIHDMRLHSFLSHSKVRRTDNYTGPIPYSEKNKIRKLIKDGIMELINFW